MRKKTKPLTKKQQELEHILLTTIPGYDPMRDAGDCRLDIKTAAFAISFFEEILVHVKGDDFAGKHFLLGNWEKAIIGNLFGWKKPDGMRRYREAFIFVPRKNGKSTLIAGLVLFIFFCDDEAGAEIYSAAADRDQASLVFDIARSMVQAEPEMLKRCRIYRKAISIDSMGICYKPVSSEVKTKHGYNAHAVVVDELHAQPNRELVDALMTSTGSRRQPLVVHITTAGWDKLSICYEKYDYACKVRDGIFKDASFLPVVYEAKPTDDWTSEDIWKKANPNYGVSLKPDYIKRECERAIEQPTYENTFKRLHLNIWTSSETKWFRTESWLACGGDRITGGDLAGRICYGGLDLASTKDLAALVLVFPREDGAYDVLAYCFSPQETAQKKEKEDKVPYLTWAKQGYIDLTPGTRIDYDFIQKKIIDISKKFVIIDIGYDRWNAEHLVKELSDEGFSMVEFQQGYKSLSPASKQLEIFVEQRRIRHGNNPVLNWAADNVMIEIDAAENIKPSKKKSTQRIDPIVALVMAIGRAMVAAVKESVYDTNEVKSI